MKNFRTRKWTSRKATRRTSSTAKRPRRRTRGNSREKSDSLAEAAAKKIVVNDDGKDIKVRSRSWSQEEDDLVQVLVSQVGPKKWALIANQLSGKTQKQAYARWRDYLQPGLTSRPWTRWERRITSWIAKHTLAINGPSWPGLCRRSPNAIKNRFHATKRKMERQTGTFTNKKRDFSTEETKALKTSTQEMDEEIKPTADEKRTQKRRRRRRRRQKHPRKRRERSRAVKKERNNGRRLRHPRENPFALAAKTRRPPERRRDARAYLEKAVRIDARASRTDTTRVPQRFDRAYFQSPPPSLTVGRLRVK